MSDYYSFISKPILDNEELIQEINNLFEIEKKTNPNYFNFSIIKRGRWTVISGIIRCGIYSITDYIPLDYIDYFIAVNETGEVKKVLK